MSHITIINHFPTVAFCGVCKIPEFFLIIIKSKCCSFYVLLMSQNNIQYRTDVVIACSRLQDSGKSRSTNDQQCVLKFPDIVKLHRPSYMSLFLWYLKWFRTLQFYNTMRLYQNNVAILLAMSLQNCCIFQFTEQTLESSLPLLLDIWNYLPFFIPLSVLKNYSRIPSSVITYSNTEGRLT